MMKLLRIAAMLCACLVAAGCSVFRSKKKPDTTDVPGIKMHDDYHIANSSLRKAQAGFSSPMEKKIFNANKAFGGTGTFKTKDFTGAKSFTGSKDYVAKSFSQGSKMNKAAEKTFAQAGEKSRLADKSFQTRDTRDSTKMSNAGDKTFRGSKNVFATKENSMAAKAMKKDTKPVITGDGAKSLTEEDVKKLLNKQ